MYELENIRLVDVAKSMSLLATAARNTLQRSLLYQGLLRREMPSSVQRHAILEQTRQKAANYLEILNVQYAARKLKSWSNIEWPAEVYKANKALQELRKAIITTAYLTLEEKESCDEWVKLFEIMPTKKPEFHGDDG